MDPTVILGILVGCGLLVKAIGLEMGMKLFFHPESLLIVLGGTLGATLVHFPISQLFKLPSRLKAIFTYRVPHYFEDISTVIRLADLMRKDGRLALENELKKIKKNPFLQDGVSFIIDGVPPEQLEHLMAENIQYMQQRHDLGIRFFEQMAKYAPGFGLIGTLIGLILMLAQLENPNEIGPSMSVALVTTFYGVLFSNLIFLPLAGRLRISSYEEQLRKQMLLEGLVAMSRQDSNYIIRERMMTLLPQKAQIKIHKKLKKKGAK